MNSKLMLPVKKEGNDEISFVTKNVGSKKFICQALLFAFGLVVLFEGITRSTRLAINQSDSLPEKAFLVLKGKNLKRGDYLSFKNSWFKAPLIKEVMGVAGDKIIKDEDGQIWVARKVGLPLTHSKDGKLLHSITPGLIPFGYVFAYASHPRSFDSRYQEVGLVSVDQALGRAFPLF